MLKNEKKLAWVIRQPLNDGGGYRLIKGRWNRV